MRRYKKVIIWVAVADLLLTHEKECMEEALRLISDME